MFARSWFDALKSRLTRTLNRHERRASGQRGPATRHLRLEPLEDRCLLAFVPTASYPVGTSPQAIVTADFNGGSLDLAVANSTSSTVSVLLGNGLGGFGATTDFATGANPRSLVVGDVSGDGKIDLITANDGGDVSILRGDGAGSFAPPDSITLPDVYGSPWSGNVPQSPHSVATGDFNGDGKLDLAVTGVASYLLPYYGYYGGIYGYYTAESAHVNVLLSDGAGGFQPTLTTSLYGLYPDSIAVGRFNADGNDDLAIANTYYGTVSVLLSDGVGGFSSSADFYTGSPSSVAARDVNGDLKTDLVAANRYGNNVSVLLGDGLGGFGVQNFAVGSEPTSVVLGDFNHDTKVDIATANFSGNDVSVLYGRGNGIFSAGMNSASPGAYALAAGDFNGDTWLDAATANLNGNNASILINDHSWPTPPPPSVSINDVTVTEGNTGTVDATFTVSLSFAHDVDVSVHYTTANGTATAGSDYSAASGDVIIPAGQSSRTLTVAVTGDRLAEPTETFAVNLSAPVNATIGDGQGTGTILDDEPLISINDVTVTEGNTGSVNATFTVTLSAASDVAVTVHYATANGTAIAGSDYQAKNGTLTFAPGVKTMTISIVVYGDKVKEADETFFVNLSGASSNSLISVAQGIGTILDDDIHPKK
jgi:hypothetical protein